MREDLRCDVRRRGGDLDHVVCTVAYQAKCEVGAEALSQDEERQRAELLAQKADARDGLDVATADGCHAHAGPRLFQRT